MAEKLTVSHPEKVLFPESGITKGELAGYYEAVAPCLLPHLAGRPITMERYPAGIGVKGFIQKDVSKGFPEWLERAAVERRSGKSEGPVHYPLVSDARSLLWLANQNTVTPHVWCSRVPELDQPDWCIFDLDPSGQVGEELRVAALAVRDALQELGLSSFVKTSGSKGYHILLSLDRSASFSDSWRFAQGVGRSLVKKHPLLFTQEFLKAERGGRILLDTGRNARGATLAAAYAVRARPGAPVSAPCTWDEIEAGAALPQSFTLRGMTARLELVGDLWQGISARAVSLRQPLRALESQLSEADWQEATASTTRRPKPRVRS
jgi:bifunctional non-homologous end joining protein LigD